MVISREKLEQQRKIRLLRETREVLTLQAAKEKSNLTKRMVDAGSSEDPTPTRLEEGQGDFDQVEEQFFDRTDLLTWLDDLIDEWGVEPEFDIVWKTMQKEPRKLEGFVNNLGLPLLKNLVRQECDVKAQEQGTDHDSSRRDHLVDDMYEGVDKPWEKSKERREDRQTDIQKKSIREADLDSPEMDIDLMLSAIGDLSSALSTLKKLIGRPGELDEEDGHLLADVTLSVASDLRTLTKLAQQVKSGVVAEDNTAPQDKTNLDKVLEACGDEEEETK